MNDYKESNIQLITPLIDQKQKSYTIVPYNKLKISEKINFVYYRSSIWNRRHEVITSVVNQHTLGEYILICLIDL